MSGVMPHLTQSKADLAGSGNWLAVDWMDRQPRVVLRARVPWMQVGYFANTVLPSIVCFRSNRVWVIFVNSRMVSVDHITYMKLIRAVQMSMGAPGPLCRREIMFIVFATDITPQRLSIVVVWMWISRIMFLSQLVGVGVEGNVITFTSLFQ